MIYSRWRPAKGGYDYFEASGEIPLGNDLPIPKLSGGTAIGVPSINVGRDMPAGARFIGTGPLARGMVAPTVSRMSLSGIVDSVPSPYLFICLGIVIGWWALEKRA